MTQLPVDSSAQPDIPNRLIAYGSKEERTEALGVCTENKYWAGKHEIRKMHDRHLENAYSYCVRNCVNNPVAFVLLAELIRRGLR